MKKPQEKQRTGYVRKLSIVLCGLAIIALLVASWLNVKRSSFSAKETAAKIFIGQIITSVLADTEFYKTKTGGGIISQVQASRDLISESYTISTKDYSWDVYEGLIVFDNGMQIKVDVIFQENEPQMLHDWRQAK